MCSVPHKELPTPRSVGEALQQRMDIYKSAAETAKSNGDDRKARMHQRIVKVLQLLILCCSVLFMFVGELQQIQTVLDGPVHLTATYWDNYFTIIWVSFKIMII